MALTTFSRREFLDVSAAAAASAALATWSAPAQAASPNDTLRVAAVGPGGRGSKVMAECITHGKDYNARVTAVCDIWSLRRERAAASVKDLSGHEPKIYKRFEQVLEDPEIDAVLITTPDHQHAKMLKLAIEAGKDIYCEKPFANVLDDANGAIDAARNSDRIIQIGTQRRSYPQYREAARLRETGIIGDVVKVDVIWNDYSPYRWAAKPEDLALVKESDLDWSAFLMGKADRPFDPRIFRSFRLFRDFSSGIIDQWMTHGVDVVHMLTGERYPQSVVAHGGLYRFKDYRENPDTIDVSLEYGTGDRKFLATYATNLANAAGKGTRVLGTKGTMEVEDVWKITGDDVRSRDHVEQELPIGEAPGTLHHMANWLDCVRRRDRSGLYCPPEAGYGHAVACIMATDAYWSGRRMKFDAEKRMIQPG